MQSPKQPFCSFLYVVAWGGDLASWLLAFPAEGGRLPFVWFIMRNRDEKQEDLSVPFIFHYLSEGLIQSPGKTMERLPFSKPKISTGAE